jgi:hypothetical protein
MHRLLALVAAPLSIACAPNDAAPIVQAPTVAASAPAPASASASPAPPSDDPTFYCFDFTFRELSNTPCFESRAACKDAREAATTVRMSEVGECYVRRAAVYCHAFNDDSFWRCFVTEAECKAAFDAASSPSSRCAAHRVFPGPHE